MKRTHLLFACFVLLTAAISGCTAPVAAPAPAAAAPVARVTFAGPADGATVASPVKVTMAAENFVVEPAGETITEGHGHLHIMVDTACIAPGEVIIKDETHLHFGQGQMEAEVPLAAGEHTLCLQAADGAHRALAGDGMQQTIQITVE